MPKNLMMEGVFDKVEADSNLPSPAFAWLDPRLEIFCQSTTAQKRSIQKCFDFCALTVTEEGPKV